MEEVTSKSAGVDIWWEDVIEKLDDGELGIAALVFRHFDFCGSFVVREKPVTLSLLIRKCLINMKYGKDTRGNCARFCWLIFESGIPCIRIYSWVLDKLIQLSSVYAEITKKDRDHIEELVMRNVYSLNLPNESENIIIRVFSRHKTLRPIEILCCESIVRFSESQRHVFFRDVGKYDKMIAAFATTSNVTLFLRFAYEFLQPLEILEFDTLILNHYIYRRHECVNTERRSLTHKVVVNGLFKTPCYCSCNLNEFTIFANGTKHTMLIENSGNHTDRILKNNIKSYHAGVLSKLDISMFTSLSRLDVSICEGMIIPTHLKNIANGCIILRAIGAKKEAMPEVIKILKALPENIGCFRMVGFEWNKFSPHAIESIYSMIFYGYFIHIGLVVFEREFGVTFWKQYLDSILLKAMSTTSRSNSVKSIDLTAFAKQASQEVLNRMNLHNAANRLPRLIY